jgi:hypothetical protein
LPDLLENELESGLYDIPLTAKAKAKKIKV